MRLKLLLVMAVVLVTSSGMLFAQQRMQEREQEFLESKPLIGDPLPEVTVYAADGTPFKTSDLRGQYTVLTFGCLTCPPSIWNIAGLEAVERDYGPQGVKFFFIFKALAHPELAGDYVQPFTIDERLEQARRAKQQFGTRIPWVVDAMDNRLKHALGDRPNAQFLVNPEGVIVRKRAWANPAQVRKDLEELVGTVEHVTREEDLRLALNLPPKSAAARGVVKRIARPQMLPIVLEPQIDPKGPEFFAKLRAEADADLLRSGAGKLYLGFHLDPLHNAHWNNLTKPLSFQIEKAAGVTLERWEVEAEKIAETSDSDPREFLLNVEAWPEDQPLKLVVKYFACVGEETCHAVRQEYVIHRSRDADGGGARGSGAGYWNPDDFARQMMRSDANKDGKLTKAEVVGIALPHFEKLDANKDGFLELEELKTIADWLNFHHQPGAPLKTSKPGQ